MPFRFFSVRILVLSAFILGCGGPEKGDIENTGNKAKSTRPNRTAKSESVAKSAEPIKGIDFPYDGKKISKEEFEKWATGTWKYDASRSNRKRNATIIFKPKMSFQIVEDGKKQEGSWDPSAGGTPSIMTNIAGRHVSYKLKPNGLLHSSAYTERAYDDYWVKISNDVE